MTEAEFRTIVEEEWEKIPPPYRDRIRNVALLIEDEPNQEVREQEGLVGKATLLGLYQGTPLSERGESYGSLPTLPDTITIYRLPTLKEAEHLLLGEGGELGAQVRRVVADTIWHEVGHYFGHDDDVIEGREDEGTNAFPGT